MIENTNNPTALEGLLLGAMIGIPTDDLIGEQEKRGQQQLVNSDRLPTELRDDRAAFEALGFTLGDPDPADPLFAPVTLPDGWAREASDHDMWSYIVDQLGRRRVAIFYKAAFYDRRADMRIVTPAAYAVTCADNDRPITTDGEWATPRAVVDALAAAAAVQDEYLETWAKGTDHAAEITARRDQYRAAAARIVTEEPRP